jgi:cullin-associated NEDD8-dissociated protein 1
VLAALSDVNEVKILGFMLLHRLCELAPTLVASRLDETTEAFDLTMRDLEVKDDTIRQDLERKGTSILRI